MSEKIKTAIFQYLLMHLSVDKLKVIVHAFVGRSNSFQAEAFSQLYDQQTRSVHVYVYVLLYQTVAILRGLRRTRKNSVP
mgnify:CR=1 FL=1